MDSEQREQERFFLDLQARISHIPADNKPAAYIETVAANISSGGAFLETDHQFAMAHKVQVEFFLSFADLQKLKFIISLETLKKLSGRQVWVQATGIVIRQEKNGIAVVFDKNYQFTPMQPADNG